MARIDWYDTDDFYIVAEATGVTENGDLPSTWLNIGLTQSGKYDWYILTDYGRNGQLFEEWSPTQWDTIEEAKAACEAFYFAAP